MFTGLIEAVGTVASLIEKGAQAELILDIPFGDELSLGDSVAINGCCLTVASLEDKVRFDILAQTLKVTSLGDLQEGEKVNLERALAIGERLGGHFVQGHVDNIGIISDLSPMGQDYRLEIALPAEVYTLCIDKGSLCIDGISLTIAELTPTSAIFWITPHTLKVTHLNEASIGQRVNLEADLLAKYVKKLLRPD
jgi:riboflavin synthase